jgi:hypothetical protein
LFQFSLLLCLSLRNSLTRSWKSVCKSSTTSTDATPTSLRNSTWSS